MEILVVSVAAFSASALTLFSGFGLGTVLMPVFTLFYPLPMAIALTAVIHFLNNIMKFILMWKQADFHVVLRFGSAAFITAFLGAKTLFWLERMPSLYAYHLGDRTMTITAPKLVIAVLILVFVFLEMHPSFRKLSFPQELLPIGGVFSGFIGGLSGHQGALRSMFLLKCGLSPERFIATGVIIACLVDVSRIAVYQRILSDSQWGHEGGILIASVLSAWAGVILASRFVKRITLKALQGVVSVMLVLIAGLLGAGVI